MNNICRPMPFVLAFVAFIALPCSVAVLAAETDVWPQFRGPGGQGHTQAGVARLPLRWDEKKNITWKTASPGRGWSSPIVGQNRIWMTTATEKGTSLRIKSVEGASYDL